MQYLFTLFGCLVSLGSMAQDTLALTKSLQIMLGAGSLAVRDERASPLRWQGVGPSCSLSYTRQSRQNWQTVQVDYMAAQLTANRRAASSLQPNYVTTQGGQLVYSYYQRWRRAERRVTRFGLGGFMGVTGAYRQHRYPPALDSGPTTTGELIGAVGVGLLAERRWSPNQWLRAELLVPIGAYVISRGYLDTGLPAQLLGKPGTVADVLTSGRLRGPYPVSHLETRLTGQWGRGRVRFWGRYQFTYYQYTRTEPGFCVKVGLSEVLAGVRFFL